MTASNKVPFARGLLARRSDRRRFLSQVGATVTAGAGMGLLSPGASPAAADTVRVPSEYSGAGRAVRVGPADPRYTALSQGFNQRWAGRPAYIEVVQDANQVVRALQEALRAGRRVTVRCGGHCYEDFVSGNDGGVILDMRPMHAVSGLPDGRFCLEGGCTNWDVYEQLYKTHNVTLPGGSCYSVGLGGHVVGGGYGLLSRLHGLTVDYLDAVEVAVVDRAHNVRLVTATKGDPRTGDLFWAHTGGGGGNFGVITKYYFRGLPQPPASVLLSSVAWPWSSLDAAGFARLVRNYGQFLAANSSPDSPYAKLFALLKLTHRSAGEIVLLTQVAGTEQRLLDTFLAAVGAGLPAAVGQTRPVGYPETIPAADTRSMPWIQATQTLNGSGPNQRGKYKSAYLNKPFPRHQVEAIYRALTDPDYANPQALLQVDSYGCRINAVSPTATAVAQRSSIMKLQYQTYWTDPAQDAYHLSWIRRFYADVYSATGGEPHPDGVNDGCYINYPDVDLKHWPQLYYKGNYPRLQTVKARWDPTNAFHHQQSVRPA